jgi:uncharacterized protein (DUF924 family)
MGRVQEILEFWFEGVDAAGAAGPECFARWFRADKRFDALIRSRFAEDVEAALAGELESWLQTPRGRLALILLLDQFTRNLHRGEARAFDGDARSLALAREAVESGLDSALRPIERYFLYLPFEHAENPADQTRAGQLYRALVSEAPAGGEALFVEAIEWARRHQNVIARFGRFPSRNAALGRASTIEELAFLKENPTGF